VGGNEANIVIGKDKTSTKKLEVNGSDSYGNALQVNGDISINRVGNKTTGSVYFGDVNNYLYRNGEGNYELGSNQQGNLILSNGSANPSAPKVKFPTKGLGVDNNGARIDYWNGEYLTGINNNTLWHKVPNSAKHSLYVGDKETLKIEGDGVVFNTGGANWDRMQGKLINNNSFTISADGGTGKLLFMWKDDSGNIKKAGLSPNM
jgi:hypothetical protein